MDKMIGKIFLIAPFAPFEELKYKKLIVYSDTPENARIAARQKYHPHDKTPHEQLVYFNPSFSACIEIEPKIISVDNKLNSLNINYEGVTYKLFKDKPTEHIGGGLI